MPQPSKQPEDNQESRTESDAILVVIEGNEDTTPRPRRPEIPYTPPPPPFTPPTDEPAHENGAA